MNTARELTRLIDMIGFPTLDFEPSGSELMGVVIGCKEEVGGLKAALEDLDAAYSHVRVAIAKMVLAREKVERSREGLWRSVEREIPEVGNPSGQYSIDPRTCQVFRMLREEEEEEKEPEELQ